LKELVEVKQSFNEKSQETSVKLKEIEESNAENLQKIEHLVIDLNKYEKELVESRQTIESLKTVKNVKIHIVFSRPNFKLRIKKK
jgi:hypothetical protein